MTPPERYRLVVDAAIFGTRRTAREYGVSVATVHKWLHHPDYESVVELCRTQVARLASDLRLGQVQTT